MMRSVFGDDSKDETGRRVFTVSGIFGSEEEWNALVKDWVARTGGRVFHAADCESDRRDFVCTSHEENRALYRDLTILLARTKFLAYTVSIDLPAYRELFPKATDPNDPYYFCLYGVIEKFAEINCLSVPLDKVEFTFDQQLDAQCNASMLYRSMLQLPDWYGHDLVSDKVSYTTRENPRIQAADLVAREGMKRLDNRIGPVYHVRRSLLALEATKRFGFIEMGREYFRTLIEKTPQLKDLPSADIRKYRQWLEESRLVDNTSNRIRYHNYILSKIQRPAQKQ
jgi:hypothetical protein